jgi:hypothetical protein
MWWIKGMTSYILNLGARWWQVVRFTPLPLNFWERVPLTVGQMTVWAQDLFRELMRKQKTNASARNLIPVP